MASLYFRYAAMNSGKSTQLLQVNFNYIERGMNPYAMTPTVDYRAGVGVISARIGLELKVDTFNKKSELYKHIENKNSIKSIDIILIEEGQFLTKEQVLDLAKVVDEIGIPVMVYGLKTDFKGEMFDGSYALLCLADKIEEIKTICWCGNKAHMNARITESGSLVRNGEQVEIGGNDRYISLCRKHFMNENISK
jgi:thymidine kinase